MKRMLIVLFAGALVSLVTTSVIASASVIPSTSSSPQVVIRHSYFGCHMWSRGGVSAGTTHTITIHSGRSFTVVNRDTSDHLLVQTSGPREMLMQSTMTRAISDGMLAHFGKTTGVTITLFTPGTYEFTTVEAAHLPLPIELTGDAAEVPDHALTLKVIVHPRFE
jgi:hypothetical protein